MQRYLGFVILAISFIVGAALAKSSLFVSGKSAYEQNDYATALKKLSSKTDAKGQFYLGNMYLNGLGTTKDPAQAARWYEKSARQGYAEAQFALGSMYSKGEGVRVNLVTAADWYLKAAMQSNSKAQFNLGIAYGTGAGVKQDTAEALKWISKSAELGNERAKKALPLLLNPKP